MTRHEVGLICREGWREMPLRGLESCPVMRDGYSVLHLGYWKIMMDYDE